MNRVDLKHCMQGVVPSIIAVLYGSWELWRRAAVAVANLPIPPADRRDDDDDGGFFF